MTLFPPEATHDANLGTMMSAMHGLGTQPGTAAGRSGLPPGDPFQLMVRRLVGPGRDGDAAQGAQQLETRLRERIVACRLDLIRTRLDMIAPAVRAELEADETDLDALLLALAKELDVASALVLLDGTEFGAAGLLASPAPALREAALDATMPGAGGRLDQACQSGCTGQITSAIGRLPLSAPERQALRRRFTESEPISQAARPEGGEPAFLNALRSGDHSLALSVLSAAALVPRDLVEAAIGLRNRRGLVSLAWKAGFSMQSAILLQSQLAGIAPDALLTATADGGCPLGRSEMVWQIGLLSRMPP